MPHCCSPFSSLTVRWIPHCGWLCHACMHACGAVSFLSMLVRFDARGGQDRAPPSAINSTAKPPPHHHQHRTVPLRHRWHCAWQLPRHHQYRTAPPQSSALRRPPPTISSAAQPTPATTISTAQTSMPSSAPGGPHPQSSALR